MKKKEPSKTIEEFIKENREEEETIKDESDNDNSKNLKHSDHSHTDKPVNSHAHVSIMTLKI